MKKSKFNCSLEIDKGEFLVFNTLSGCLAVVYDNLENYLAGSNDHEELLQGGFVVEDDVDEDLIASYWLHRRQFNYTELKLEILPTYQCNLNCEYCAAKNRISNKSMDNVLAEQVALWIIQKLNRMKSRRLHLTFSGGEPFMNLDAIFRICRQLCDFCNKTYVDFSFSIITNGTLLKRKSVRELCSLGLRGIQITLDGPSEIHDKRRPKNNGEGSFYDVFRNLKQVVDLVKLVSIRINLDFQNSETIPRFLHELTSQGMHRQNVQIQIARTYNIDLASEIAQRRQKEYKNITVKRMIELYSLAKQLGFQIAIDKDSAFMPYEMCMFVSPNSFVIDPEGGIYKCIGFVSNPEFRIGHVSKENFTDTLAEHIILGTKITQDPFCNKCAFRPVCNGGCRYLTYVQTGDPWKRICPKQYFQRASLELLRINYLSERELENGNK